MCLNNKMYSQGENQGENVPKFQKSTINRDEWVQNIPRR